MMKRDERHIQQIVKLTEDNMIDPFDVTSHPKDLVSIGSGLVATPEISESSLNETAKGTSMMNEFVRSRLTVNIGNPKSVHQPITKSGLETFKDMEKQTKLTFSGKTSKIAVSPELIHKRALTLAKKLCSAI